MIKTERLKISRLVLIACLCVSWSLGSLGCGGSGEIGTTDWEDELEPTAKAGPDQNVTTGSLVTLDGSRSDSFKDSELTYFWAFLSLPSGSAATLSAPAAVRTTFTADIDGEYVVRLVVAIGDFKDSDSVKITATTANSSPMASAGEDQNVATGSIVTLSGLTSSDANNDPLTYSWSFVSRPVDSTASLSASQASEPTFIPDVDGSFVLELTVDDGMDSSTPDIVVINAATDNSSPVAEAGPDQKVVQGSNVNLDGRASHDADNDFLTYSWAFISKPSESQATLSGSRTSAPFFSADVSGFYVIRLIVDDGIDNSLPDHVTVLAYRLN